MPHQTHLRTFGRTGAHRRAMLRNLTMSVLRYERVKTTEAKAKEVRRLVDRMIGLGKQGTLAARRRANAFLYEPIIVEKLFDDLAKRFTDRDSGYTRITHLGLRVGDKAPVMLIELMPGAEETAKTEAAAAEEAKPRRRLGIPRRAKKAEAAEGETAGAAKRPRKRATTAKA